MDDYYTKRMSNKMLEEKNVRTQKASGTYFRRKRKLKTNCLHIGTQQKANLFTCRTIECLNKSNL